MSENIAKIGGLTADKQVIFVDHFLTTQVSILHHINTAISAIHRNMTNDKSQI